MSDGIDNDINYKGFGKFSDETTDGESTHGDKYSRQVGDSVTVQDGNKSTLLNGWSNTVTGGSEFKTVGGAYYTTVGGNSFSTIVGAGFNVSAGLRVDMIGGASAKFTYGSVFEYTDTDLFRVNKGKVCNVGKQRDVVAVPETSLINNLSQLFSQLIENIATEKKDIVQKSELVAEGISVVANQSDTSLLGQQNTAAGQIKETSATTSEYTSVTSLMFYSLLIKLG